MPTLTIDNRPVEVAPGQTILDAARRLRIEIPTLCYLEGCEPNTSCMVCLVRLAGGESRRDEFVPACGTRAVDGMQVASETPEVHAARRTSLELLLGDHLGDCEAPCHLACPAHMDIPRMIRQIAEGRLDEAIATVKRDIPLPAVLGRICPAPCEKACRRGGHDEPLAICLLKRFVGDADLASPSPYLPQRKPDTGKRVAVVGAGPTGLSAAFYLLQDGHACTILDEHDEPGGMLRRGVPEDRLPRDVLRAEIETIARLGAHFRPGVRVGSDPSLDDLLRDFDAVLIATGLRPGEPGLRPGEPGARPAEAGLRPGEAGAAPGGETKAPSGGEPFGLRASAAGIETDPAFQTSREGVFAAGDAVRKGRMAVRAVAAGKAAAACIGQYLAGEAPQAPQRPFSTHVGRLKEGEIETFLVGASPAARIQPESDSAGLSGEQARAEAARCLHCDCRKPRSCLLRRYAQAYGARPRGDRAHRRTFQQQTDHPEVIYEPGKCIACGLCVQLTARAGEPFGMTFTGRSFGTRVAVPFGKTLADGLGKVAAECVRACPTGALAFKD